MKNLVEQRLLKLFLKFPDTKKNNDEDEKEDDFEDWGESSEKDDENIGSLKIK